MKSLPAMLRNGKPSKAFKQRREIGCHITLGVIEVVVKKKVVRNPFE